MTPEPQFTPMDVLLAIVAQAWNLPPWVLFLLVALVLARVFWPWLFAERATARRRRRFRRRHWYDD